MPRPFFSPQHPLWLAGFRPFFILALISGFILPLVWALVFSGGLLLPNKINAFQWHAHEMLFGFGGAVIFGFLLTASKNWVKVRGIHGLALMGLCSLWLFERVFLYFAFSLPPLFKHMSLSIFTTACCAYIGWTLLRNHKSDSFKDNYFFILILVLFVISKNLLISDTFYQNGIALSIGIFRLAFVVMFERTMPQFMKNTTGIELYKNAGLNLSIKIFVLISAFESFLPKPIGACILSTSGILLGLRWLKWKPHLGLQKFSNATMYVGNFGLIAHLVLQALKGFDIVNYGTIAIHVFTFACMGIVIPSMIIRISKGHTGRKPEFGTLERLAISLMGLSAIARLLLTLIFTRHYPLWITLAGIFWSGCFFILAILLTPLLWQARVDGKIH